MYACFLSGHDVKASVPGLIDRWWGGATVIHTGPACWIDSRVIGGDVIYTRFYTDETGETHIEDGDIEFASQNFAPPAPPLFLSPFVPAARFGYLRFPPGWEGDWHPTPRRQMLIFLSGEVEGETSDGQRQSFGPGSVVLLEDTIGKGHRSRVVSDGEAIAAVVQLPD